MDAVASAYGAGLVGFSGPESGWAPMTLRERVPKTVRDNVIRDNAATLQDAHLQAINELLAEIETGQPIRPVAARDEAEATNAADIDEWKEYMKQYVGRTWEQLPFYVGEAFLYRRILAATGYFAPGNPVGDPFLVAKRKGIEEGKAVMHEVTATLLKATTTTRATTATDMPSESEQLIEENLVLFLLRSLWGNRADLSLFSIKDDPLVARKSKGKSKDHKASEQSGGENEAGKEEKEKEKGEGEGEETDYLMVDHTDAVCKIILDKRKEALSTNVKPRFDFIVDNAGLELFSDLCFAHYLTWLLDAQIHIHVKSHPTFVSDVTAADVDIMVDYLAAAGESSGSREFTKLGKLWRSFLTSKQWTVKPHRFWNAPSSSIA
eukprot:TRINITY_DN4857_c0_g1_i1.p1 TRINITY_DN4857_c0_g1~~TRINITY_DN4857_c0_g1_i1.p1  ORF type:complete len:379 (-),score=81.71 TRINITY_DN4857_c0_g1_i1:298-1434(-)